MPHKQRGELPSPLGMRYATQESSTTPDRTSHDKITTITIGIGSAAQPGFPIAEPAIPQATKQTAKTANIQMYDLPSVRRNIEILGIVTSGTRGGHGANVPPCLTYSSSQTACSYRAVGYALKYCTLYSA